MLDDGFSILLDCVRALRDGSPGVFNATLLACTAFAALAWWTAAHAPTLWNRRFQPSGPAHALCALAAVLTIAFGVSISALGRAKGVATNQITAWRELIAKDQKAHNEAAAQVYHAVKASNLETFGPQHTVSSNGANYPVTKPETRKLTSKTYVKAALDNLQRVHPFLYAAIWQRADVPYDRVLEDRQNWDGTRMYPVSRYFEVASQEVLVQLDQQAERAVYRSRRFLTVLFLCAQALAFAVVAFTSFFGSVRGLT